MTSSQRPVARGVGVTAARPPGGGGAADWLERAALFTLLLVIAMRAMLSETYESAEGLFAEYVRGAGITTSATTAGFDLVVWLAALAAGAAAGLARRQRQAAGWRWTGLEIGWLIMIVAAAASTCLAASNRRLALNACVDWLSAPVLAMTLANLCRDRLRTALVIGVVVAAGAASVAKSIVQVTGEYRITFEDYQQNKAKLWGDLPLDDPRVLLYERRLRANEASGFLSHSNCEGSLLMLCGFAAVAAGGLTGNRWARRLLYAGGASIAAVIPITGSKGALLAAAAGVLLLLIWYGLRVMMRRHWRWAVGVGWACVALGIVGVATYGLARGGLPGSSMSFRWNYWQVTARIVGDHPWSGVGALNFDRAYTQYKPIEYPEEIRDPHNFMMAILAQWGAPGLVGLVAAIAGASIVAMRRWTTQVVDDSSPIIDYRRALRQWLPAVVAGFVVLRIWMLSGLMGSPSGDASVFVDLIQYGLLWAICVITVTAAGVAGGRQGGPDWRMAIMCGLVAFLLHNVIDFSLFVPATLTVFAGLAGAALARRMDDRSWGDQSRDREGAIGRRPTKEWLVTIGAAAGCLIVLLLVVIPVNRSNAALSEARTRPADTAVAFYEKAAAADPLDPTPLLEEVERFAREPAPEQLDVTLETVGRALERDPRQSSLYRWRGRLLTMRYGLNGREEDLRGAIASARRVVELYPQSPDEHLDLADMLAHAAIATGRQQWTHEAIEEYAKALDLDAARPGTDEVRKWTVKKRAEVGAAMKAIQIVPATGSAPG